ncbi:uncharacterized protein LODBEIA_P44660 [Lodderomyces beijingensis]|uniref:BRCT domain-containing protein n=1 Tax=Lodderomyces beijingensis TaxID=1775926 RepID=A0ABP0ZQ34_9ASCO
MFQGQSFLIVASPELNSDEAAKLERLLKENDAETVYIKQESDNSHNYVDTPTITHIVSRSIAFVEYSQALRSMIPVTTPDWVFKSIDELQLQPVKPYNPDPAYFMKDCFICCADNLPSGDKELIYDAVRAFGGNYVDILSKYTTHLIAMDMSNEKSIIAASIMGNEFSSGPYRGIKIVYPHWVDRCISKGRRLDETKYLVPGVDPCSMATPRADDAHLEILLNDSLPKIDNNDDNDNDNDNDDEDNDDDDSSDASLDFFKGKKIHLGSDFNLSQRLHSAIERYIGNFGAMVEREFSQDIDIYLGKYRAGDAYEKSMNSGGGSSGSGRILVANLQWFFSIVVSKKWTIPLNSNILYFPMPPEPIKAFKDLNISITNYSGEARSYLTRLIASLGATFTKTLTKDNDYLICAKPEGKKYDAARARWFDELGDPEVIVVNHVWLEDCFIKWAKLSHSDEKYTNFGSSIGMEPLVGRVHLDADLLTPRPGLGLVGSIGLTDSSKVEDSMSEDESTQRRSKRQASVMSSVRTLTRKNTTDLQVGDEITNLSLTPVFGTPKRSKETATPNQSDLTVDLLSPKTPVGFVEPIGGAHRYGGRSAAKKAAAKLHDNMSDLNAYQKMTKSKKEMKHYMDELEVSVATKRRHQDPMQSNVDNVNPAEEEKLSEEGKKRRRMDECSIVAILTGCESDVVLDRNDYFKLETVGIKIIQDVSKVRPNTLIAPKILRTEKFLRSLSTVDKIVHPSYIVHVLENIENGYDVLNRVQIENYRLDKCNSTVEADLDLRSLLKKSSVRGKLFADIELNLSSNLNGGLDVIARILNDHGLKNFKEVKTVPPPGKKSHQMLECEINGSKLSILIANKTKDSKLTKAFRKSVDNGIVLSWDWCVKSIFAMQIQSVDEFQL